MKFSWKILNFFINLESIHFTEFIEKLALAGFEVEEIEENNKTIDKIINLNITSNRKEIFCIINLAQEISIILNIPLKIKLIPIKYYKDSHKNKTNKIIQKSAEIIYIKIQTITNLLNNESPKWLKNHLQSCNIISSSLLSDIQQYINIKWGQEILIFNLNELTTKFLDFNLIDISKSNISNANYIEKIIYNHKDLFYLNKTNDYLTLNNKTQNIILCFIIRKININNLTNTKKIFHNAYYETIKLISTFGKGIVNKSYQENIPQIFLDNKQVLKIKKNNIKYILGPLNIKTFKFLSNHEIINCLKQLKFKVKYSYKYKIFKIQIPNNRQHDLKRDIDIIEEISRIYGFQYFLNHLPNYQTKGNISKKSFYKNKIRYILRDLGLNEVIHTSLTHKKLSKLHNVKIYNPITEDQKFLRNNIIENLIQNYKVNSKQKTYKTEIFEIGQIFYSNNIKNYIEETHVGGLIYNTNFIKQNWSNKSTNLNWFHAKGIIENFFERLNVHITWHKLLRTNEYTTIQHIHNYFHYNKVIYIYNQKNNNLIGIFGQINHKYFDNIDKNPIYLFEINLTQLIKGVYLNKHLNYRAKKYSIYPSVIRDISINIKQNKNIHEIKSLVQKNNIDLIESIELISEYYNKKISKRFICLRITYRSYNRTLNNIDIEKINHNIQELLK